MISCIMQLVPQLVCVQCGDSCITAHHQCTMIDFVMKKTRNHILRYRLEVDFVVRDEIIQIVADVKLR